MSAGRANGTLLTNFRTYVRGLRGADGWNALMAKLPQSDQDVYASLVVSASWYPVGTWNRSVDAYLADSSDRRAEIQRVARHIANQDFHALFKLLLRMGTIEFILSRSDSLWCRYFDGGHISILDQTTRRWRLALDAPTDVDAGAGQVTCDVGVCTWMTHVMELAGTRVEISHP